MNTEEQKGNHKLENDNTISFLCKAFEKNDVGKMIRNAYNLLLV